MPACTHLLRLAALTLTARPLHGHPLYMEHFSFGRIFPIIQASILILSNRLSILSKAVFPLPDPQAHLSLTQFDSLQSSCCDLKFPIILGYFPLLPLPTGYKLPNIWNLLFHLLLYTQILEQYLTHSRK